ncbi:MAG: hypothetical protein DRJ69_03120 [Thermoprotei archaeon]|nr:MAG: hypothetical protein DRJ69_03120 [Thermoprotei archaeon]
MTTLTIVDCRGKERMEISRYNGDVLLSFKDRQGNILFQFAMKMTENSERHYQKVIQCFKLLKMYIEG